MRNFVIFILLLLPLRSLAATEDLSPSKHAERIESDFRVGKMNDRTLEAIEAALTYGAGMLREKGHDKEAEQIMSDWFYREKAFILEPGKQMGDHSPIDWLFNVWAIMDTLLGREIMIQAHLDDLWIFAYSIKPCITCQDNIDKPEYALHFVGGPVNSVKLFEGGFAGSVTYWTALIACSAGVSYPWALLCSPVAQLAEWAMERFIAPPLSPRIWGLVCESNL